MTHKNPRVFNVDCAAPGISAYIFKMVELATFGTPHSIHRVLPQFVFLSAVFTSSSSAECIHCRSFVCVPNIFCTVASKFFVSCKLLITAIWALWVSILFAQVSTFTMNGSIFFTFCKLSYNFC